MFLSSTLSSNFPFQIKLIALNFVKPTNKSADPKR